VARGPQPPGQAAQARAALLEALEALVQAVERAAASAAVAEVVSAEVVEDSGVPRMPERTRRLILPVTGYLLSPKTGVFAW
jgi:hypothetical protein